jgi:hypothetical protein
MRRKNKKLYIGLAVAVGLPLVGLIAFLASQQQSAKSPAVTPQVTKGNATEGGDESTPTATAAPVTTPQAIGTTPAPTAAANVPAPAKPMLSMSSGNAGAVVPAGRAMEFTCEGVAAGPLCTLVLTDKNNASHQVNLGAQTITSNGHGQNLATWTWTAQAGSWKVVATASTSGGSAASDALSLEVK